MPPFLRTFLPLRRSMIFCLLCLLSPLISLCLQMGSLTSTSDVCDLLTINPLIALCQNARVIYAELSNGCLVLDSIFKLLLLRILRKRELGFSLGSIVARHWKLAGSQNEKRQ